MFRKSRIPFIILIAAAGFLRFFLIGKNSLWYDEVLSLFLAKKAPFIWNPPIYFLLLKFWVKTAGISEFVLRLPSALFSLAAVAVVYRTAVKMFGKKTALLSAAIMSFSAFQLWYAQEARPYSLALFLGTLSSYYLCSWLKEKKKKYAFYYLLALSAAVYTHYYCLILFIFQLAYISIVERQHKSAAAFMLGAFFAFSLILKGVIAKFIYVKEGFWIPKPYLHALGTSFANFFLGYNGTDFLYILAYFLICFILYKMLLAYLNKDIKGEVSFCIFAGVLPIFAVFILSKVYFPLYLDRAFIVFTPYLYILTSFYIANLKSRYIRTFFTLAVFICLGIADINYYRGRMYEPQDPSCHIGVHPKKPFRPLALFIKKSINQPVLILTANVSITFPLVYYLYRSGVGRKAIWQKVFFAFDRDAIDSNRGLTYKKENIANKAKIFIEKNKIPSFAKKKGIRKIFLLACDWPRSGALDQNSLRIKSFLDGRFRLESEKDFAGIKVFIYEKP